MLNPFREVNWRPGLLERRRFAVSLMLGFPGVAVVVLAIGRGQGATWNFGPPLWVAGAGLALGLMLWWLPQITRPFYVAWYAVACALSFIVGNVALAAVFFLLVVPLGLVLRASGRRPMRKGFDRSARTYWRDAPAPPEPERYYRQF